jgi:hypothetical protein
MIKSCFVMVHSIASKTHQDKLISAHHSVRYLVFAIPYKPITVHQTVQSLVVLSHFSA